MKIRAILVLFFSFVFLLNPAVAQLKGCKPKDAAAIKNSIVYIILKPGQDEVSKIYNQLMLTNIPKYWTFGRYAFVGMDTIDRVIFNKNVYFMTTFDEEIISTNGAIQVSSIGIIKGGKAFSKYKHTEEMAWVYVRKNLWEYANRFASMLQVLQNTLIWTADPANKKKDIYESFNKMAWMKDKVLYLEKKDINEKLLDVEKIEKVYKYPFKIVDTEELRRAIEAQDDKVVYMHLTNNRNSSCFFIAAKNGVVVFENKASINTQIQLISTSLLEAFDEAIDLALAGQK